MKKTIITLIIGIFIGFTINVCASYVYTARDIGYTPQDEKWEVSNASEALSSLKSDLNNVNQNVTEYKQQITEALADKGVEVDENSSMSDITSGITNMGSTDVYYLGTGTSFDIKTLFPNDYQNFTVDNFIIEPTKVTTALVAWNSTVQPTNTKNVNINKTYNQSTGTFTISNTGVAISIGDAASSGGINDIKVYLVLGSIENIN